MNERQTSMTIIWHRYDDVGTVLLSIVMYINGRLTFVRTITVQWNWGARSTAVLITMLCGGVIVVCTVVLSTDICTAW